MESWYSEKFKVEKAHILIRLLYNLFSEFEKVADKVLCYSLRGKARLKV